MEYLTRLIEFLEEIYDQGRLQAGRLRDFLEEAISDFIWRMIEVGGRGLGIAAIKGFRILPNERERRSPLAQWPLQLIAILILVLICSCIQLLVSSLGVFETIFGLRKGVEHSFKENMIAVLPLVIIGASLPWIGVSEFSQSQLCYLFSYSIIILGLNILTGVAGLNSLGHAGFVLVGAYTSVLLFQGELLGFPIYSLLSVLCGGIVAAVLGLALGFPAVRVKGPYLTLVTLGFMLSAAPVLRSSYLEAYTHGFEGINFSSPSPPSYFKFVTQANWMYYLTLFCFTVMFIAGYILIYRTKIGRAFVAIKDSEERSCVLGINVPFYKMLSFAISAFYAGVGGGLLALNIGFVSPDSFTLNDSFNYWISMAIGGVGTLFGSVVGGAFLAFQPYITQFLNRFINHGEMLLWAAYGLFVIIAMIFFPRGVAGEIGSFLYKLRFELPLRRKHRKDSFPDYDPDEELLSAVPYAVVAEKIDENFGWQNSQDQADQAT